MTEYLSSKGPSVRGVATSPGGILGLLWSLADGFNRLGQDAVSHDCPDVLLYAFSPMPFVFPTLLRVILQGHRLPPSS